MQISDDIIKLIAEKLETGVPEIQFAYLFGSSVTQKSSENSDLDIAVYLDHGAKSMELIAQIINIIEAVLPQKPVDLVLLNDAGVIISMEALKGKPLFVRDEAQQFHSGYYSLICRKYEDQMAWMKKQLKYRGHEVQWGN